jgi:putative phosphonate metabolism protein
MPSARYAIYYTPPPESPLARFGARVLGYDCFAGTAVPHRAVDGIEPALLALATVQPRRYGFHATLVAPFRLRGSEADLRAAMADFAVKQPPVMLGALRVMGMGDFVVLRPAQPFPAIEEFAAICVEAFDGYRTPLTADERARRLMAGLTPRQVELLDRWGYPHVLDEFRFHMTLAGPLPNGQHKVFETRLEQAFGRLAADHIELDAVTLLRQDDAAASFRVVERLRLSGR